MSGTSQNPTSFRALTLEAPRHWLREPTAADLPAYEKYSVGYEVSQRYAFTALGFEKLTFANAPGSTR